MFALRSLESLLIQRTFTQPTESNVFPPHSNEKKVEVAVKETLGDFSEKLAENNAQLEKAHQRGYSEGGRVTVSTQKLFAHLRALDD